MNEFLHREFDIVEKIHFDGVKGKWKVYMPSVREFFNLFLFSFGLLCSFLKSWILMFVEIRIWRKYEKIGFSYFYMEIETWRNVLEFYYRCGCKFETIPVIQIDFIGFL